MAGKYYDKDLCSTANCSECCGCKQHEKAYLKALYDVIKHLEEVESHIVFQRNNVKSIADSKMIIGMHMAVEDTLGWLKDQIKS